VRLRLAAAAALAVPLAAGSASAAKQPVPNWAAAQIQTVVADGLMDASSSASFHPNDPLTQQALAGLTYQLSRMLAPAASTEPTASPGPLGGGGARARTTASDGAPGDPPPSDTSPPASTVTDPTTTTPDPDEPAPASQPPQVSNPDAPVTLAQLDAQLVASLGLSVAAAEFAAGARASGVKVPARFGTEVVARLLGLRTNHPAAEDDLELRPQDPATRAEAAYSAAVILGFGSLGASSQTAAVQPLADSFALPVLDPWQQRILTVAFSKIGMPYIWGGTSDGPEAPFGVRSRGGYDCSGFVWRVYKLQKYPDEGTLASTLRGRTTYAMAGEVPRSERISYSDLQPADVIFFGAHGPRSTPAQVGHMGIYIGDGWFIHSSDYGVALAQLTGWYRQEFAWGRRPLQEAGLTTS